MFCKIWRPVKLEHRSAGEIGVGPAPHGRAMGKPSAHVNIGHRPEAFKVTPE
jgi:hypothetical protein